MWDTIRKAEEDEEEEARKMRNFEGRKKTKVNVLLHNYEQCHRIFSCVNLFYTIENSLFLLFMSIKYIFRDKCCYFFSLLYFLFVRKKMC